jgi:hypothetical protein
MIDVVLQTSSSPVEKIGKTLTTGNTYSCALKDNCSILKPVIIIRTTDTISAYNYMYIQNFGRYYFIDDIVTLHDGVWQISAHVDPLDTFMEELMLQDVIVNKQSTKGNKYLNDGSFVSQVNEFNTSYNFSGGFNDSGTFILICAGG